MKLLVMQMGKFPKNIISKREVTPKQISPSPNKAGGFLLRGFQLAINSSFHKLLNINDLRRAGPPKCLTINDLQQNAIQFNFFLAIIKKVAYYVYMKETVKVLMSRDGLTQAEAVKQVVTFFKSMQADIVEGGDPFQWENDFVQEFGLEPDYFEDFLFRLC